VLVNPANPTLAELLGMSSHMPLFSAVARHTMHKIEGYYCDSKQ